MTSSPDPATPPTAPLASPPDAEQDVVEQRNGAVCTLTLNRPRSLNSFTSGMIDRLRAALERAAADTSVRCVVIAASGRAFCAGQDLSDPAAAPNLEPGAPSKDLGVLLEQHYHPMVQRLRTMPVPTLAVVQGVAAGAGANLALCCDIVVAGQSASFIQAFAKIGLVPDTGGTWSLPRLVGRAKALGLAMLGDKLPAVEAERWGLIWRCVDDSVLVDTSMQIAQQLAAMPTRALVATREAIDAAPGLHFDQAFDAEVRRQRVLGHAGDYAEGVRAFMDKRAPSFSDR
jgi:2-(1,2-epoxy-1,2-dihydrophenyl)acetyl-CoA isomerase